MRTGPRWPSVLACGGLAMSVDRSCKRAASADLGSGARRPQTVRACGGVMQRPREPGAGGYSVRRKATRSDFSCLVKPMATRVS
jgi:hypothetical protein